MSDLGFLPVVQELLDQTRPDAQRLLFSATLDGEVDTLVRRYLKDPARHEVKRAGDDAPPAEHLAYSIAFRDKVPVTEQLAARPGRTLVFVRTQLGADRLASNLQAAGIKAEAIHGGLPQGARRRALEAFTDARSPVLVATDVAARGIHVDDVSLVLHYDPPADHKTYLHRSGRTARAGERGTVVTLALPHQRRQMERLVEQAGVDVKPIRTAPGDPLLYDGVGARTPSGEAIEEGRYRRLVEGEPRPQRGHSRGGARYQPHGRRNERSFRGRDDRGDRGSRDARGGRDDRGGRDRSARRYDG